MNIVTLKRKTDKNVIPEQFQAAGIIPVLAYSPDDHLFLVDDKSLGFVFSCQPLCGGDDKVQERVHGFLNQEMPPKTTVQFVLFRSPDIDLQMNSMLALRDNYRHDLLTPVIKERIGFLKQHTVDRLVTQHSTKGVYDNGIIQDLKLFITCKIPINDSVPTEQEILEIKLVQTKIESGLQTIGLRPMKMTATSYIRTMSTILNWGPSASWRNGSAIWEEDKPICDQLFDYTTDIEVTKNSLKLGNYHVKVLSAKKMPDMFYFGDAISYIGDLTGGNNSIKGNYMVVTNIFFPEVEKTRNSLERKRQLTVNQAYGPLLKFVPVLADKKESFDLLYDSMKEGAKPVKITYSVVVFSPTKKEAEASAIAARSIWRESRFDLMEDKFITLPMFVNCLPLCTDRDAIEGLRRYKTMTTEQATVLLPIFGEWKGTGTFHAALLSRNGQIMSLSAHDSDTNKNVVIAAESGSGKSFLTNELILSYMSEGAQVWVVDAGKSYEKLSKSLNGDFVHFEDGTNVCLNPFELIENYEDEEDAIVSIVSMMASAKGMLDEWQTASLKQVMGQIWSEKGKAMLIDDVAERCLAGTDQRLKDIGMQLFAFTSKGSYGKFFSGKNNVSFQNQFTVLELDELQGRKHLRQVVLLQLIYQIQQEVFLGERNRKKIVIIDEAWDLLKEGEVSVFIEHAYRKFRKYGGTVIIATQSINDLYENAVGRAIAENSASMYLLGQTEETIESVKRSARLTLSDGGFNLLKTVHTVAGVYSELFVKSKAGIGVGRLIVGEFQKLLYSTDPVDVNAIEQLTKRGLTIPDAINSIIQQRRQVA